MASLIPLPTSTPPSPVPAWARHPALAAAVALTLAALVAFLSPPSVLFASPAEYAPAHTGMEFVAITMALLVFAVGWDAPSSVRTPQFTAFTCAFAAVALLDFAHTLAYPGMPDFLGANTPQRAIALWLAARALSAVALIALALEPPRGTRRPCPCKTFLAVTLAATIALATALLAAADRLPTLHVAGVGLTGTKVAAEIALILLFATAAVIFARRTSPGAPDRAWLAAAAWASMLAEGFFASYSAVTDVENVLGHALKIAAFAMLWHASINRAVHEPRRALAESEARFRDLARLSADWYWEQDAQLRFTRIDGDQVGRSFLAPERALGRTRREALRELAADFDWDAHERLLAARQPFRDLIIQIRQEDGPPRFLSLGGEPRFDEAGRFIGYRGVGKEVTDRVRLERALRDSEERLRAAFEAGGHAPWEWDMRAGGEPAPATPEATLPDGRGTPVAPPPRLEPLMHPDDVAEARQSRESHLAGRSEREVAGFRLRAPDGSWRWMLSSGRVTQRDAAGRPLRMVGTLTDVTERKAIERQLAESNQRFFAVFERSAIALALIDYETGRIIDLNEADEELVGASADKVVGRTALELGLWPDAAERERAWARLRQDGRLTAFLCRQRSLKGVERDVLMYAETVMLNGRRVVLAQKVDVTEQRRVEARLEESEQWMRALFERSPLSGLVIDLETRRIVEANAELCAFFGREREEIIGRTTVELGLWNDTSWREDFYERLRREGSIRPVDVQLKRGDGTVADVALTAEILRRAGRPLLIIQGIDVSARVRAQRELAAVNAQLERRVEERTQALRASNEELEAFSYTVAHDLRAPLRAIDGYSHLLGDAASEGDAKEVPDLLAKIRRNVTGMERLIDGLLHYARLGRQSLAAVPVDMARLATEAQLTLADQYPRTAIVVEPMPPVRGDPEMLRQVWMNLLANACKFSRDAPEPRVTASAQAVPGGTTFHVQDNGVGFDMAYADKLFGMFQRLHTEREFGGSGVGLAVVARIVARHGGRTWADGAPGRGATFSFFLPG